MEQDQDTRQQVFGRGDKIFFKGKCQKKHLDSQDADKMIWCVIHIYCLVLDNGCMQLCVLSDWAFNPKLEFLYRLLFGFNLSNRFFDMTPLGLILNRFSADTNIIDQVDISIYSVLLSWLHQFSCRSWIRWCIKIFSRERHSKTKLWE